MCEGQRQEYAWHQGGPRDQAAELAKSQRVSGTGQSLGTDSCCEDLEFVSAHWEGERSTTEPRHWAPLTGGQVRLTQHLL